MYSTRIPVNMTLTLSIFVTIALLFITSVQVEAVAGETDGTKTIEGTITYRERMMLPPSAEVFVFLEDSAKTDVAAEVVAQTGFTPQGGPPWDFVLEYDPALIQEKGRYGLRVRVEVEGRLFFINTSHIPAFDQDPGMPIEIIVSRVGSRPDASLTDTYWKLVEVNGKAATLGAGKKEVHLVLAGEGNKVRGFGGCNQFMGSYKANDKKIQFGPLAATMMACMEGMEQEQEFLKALESVRHFSISGEQLTLRDDEGQTLLLFKSVYLK